ncbi:4-hydroxyphenylpyruvate dioxygenase [Loa loa]|uniref:4-hydroxyphenylpyruvate dioxygenase n=1 Tax=Loa loa TaxID=7209 RepID=A0A1S0U6Y3_LOALO|nr:4-hydroxyphenylpyruvate dioxygenase [Loa loa]EFO26178.1 4-hydroxyphenylpyruvate dioxygenase [Loa loa]
MLGPTALKGLPLSIHHVEFYVSNALQSSYWYCISFGFQRFAKKENARWRSIAIRNGNIVFIFTTCKLQDKDFMEHLTLHGDSVRDVSFLTNDISAAVKRIVEEGGFLVKPIEIVADDDGFVKTAVISSPECDVCHSLLDSKTYRGFFLPNYEQYDCSNDILKSVEEISIVSVDHLVINYPIDFVKPALRYYHQIFDFEEIWSADESIFSSSRSGMKIVLIANKSKSIQIGFAEPIPRAVGVRSQIQEFLDYNGGAGVQHIAFLVDDIIQTAERMKQRGVEFIPIPDEYYTDLEARLAISPVNLLESFEKIKELRILMDFDDHGYLLQMFTQPVQDRPTLFFEVIQRNNYSGFGAGNINALFNAVEKEQERRGTLHHGL